MIGIAADDPMHGDDVRGLDTFAEGREVAVHTMKAIGDLPRLGFATGGVEICGRGVDERGRANATRQQLEVENTDAATDIEERRSAADLAAQSVEEQT